MRSTSALVRHAALCRRARRREPRLRPCRACRRARSTSTPIASPELIDPLLKAFTQRDRHQDQRGVRQRRSHRAPRRRGQEQPRRCAADATSSGCSLQAVAAGVTQPMQSDADRQGKSRPKLRDPEGQWFGLTRRARVVYASKDRVKQDAITYEELADPKWRGKICIRSGQHTYNVALVASMIANDGEAQGREAGSPASRPTWRASPPAATAKAVRDVQAGLCDIAIGNTYYMAAMLKNPDQKAWADAVKHHLPQRRATAARTSTSRAWRWRPMRRTRTTPSS